MPYYKQLGEVPAKRHTINRKTNGTLLSEHVYGAAGFSGMSSILYHLHPPTRVLRYGNSYSALPEIDLRKELKMSRLSGFKIKPTSDFLESRKIILTNDRLHITLAAPQQSLTTYFYSNADCDEVIFIHKGAGILHTLWVKFLLNTATI